MINIAISLHIARSHFTLVNKDCFSLRYIDYISRRNFWLADVVVFCFDAMWFRRSMPTFRRNMMSPSSRLNWQSCEAEGLYRLEEGRLRGRSQSGRSFVTSALKTETASFSEASASAYETIRRQNPRQRNVTLTAVKNSNLIFWQTASYVLVYNFNYVSQDMFRTGPGGRAV
jgi:hypothetical protein